MFQRIYPPAIGPLGAPCWVVLRGNDLVLPAGGSPLLDDLSAWPDAELDSSLLLGALDERPVRAMTLDPASELPHGFEAVGLRTLFVHASEQVCAIADYAIQIANWTRHAQHCAVCGQLLGPVEGTWGRGCAACGHTLYPPVSPAIIVLIHDGDRALLTTKAGWGARYSLVAGFVEPGETLESCVVREVREEVGVEVGALRYVKSQSWPFPHQLMVGFLAAYAGGEIAIDTSELADARWFSIGALPELPQPYTIARQIIEFWRAELAAASGSVAVQTL
jgi:NAD+ diphosphatase